VHRLPGGRGERGSAGQRLQPSRQQGQPVALTARSAFRSMSRRKTPGMYRAFSLLPYPRSVEQLQPQHHRQYGRKHLVTLAVALAVAVAAVVAVLVSALETLAEIMVVLV